MLSCKVNATAALKMMKQAEKQSRFALAKTFTGAAFEARKATIANLPKWLTLRNQFLSRSVIVERADRNNLEARVGFHKRADWAERLEEGGTRRPRKGANIAIPQGVRPSQNSLVPKRLRPSALRNRKDVFRKEINGIDGLWQVLPGRRVKLLFSFDESTQYEQNKIYFLRTASAVAIKFIANNVEKNFVEAMKTAK